jgi:hypothetical protein
LYPFFYFFFIFLFFCTRRSLSVALLELSASLAAAAPEGTAASPRAAAQTGFLRWPAGGADSSQ